MLFVEHLPIKILDDKVLLYVKVTPKASSDKIGKILDGTLKIYVRAVPENGQANKAVIELLSDSLKIAKSNISIDSGFTFNKKTVSLFGDRDSIIKHLQIMISN